MLKRTRNQNNSFSILKIISPEQYRFDLGQNISDLYADNKYKRKRSLKALILFRINSTVLYTKSKRSVVLDNMNIFMRKFYSFMYIPFVYSYVFIQR